MPARSSPTRAIRNEYRINYRVHDVTDPASDPAPVASTEHSEFLDVLRGVALFGIFVVNLPVIALPFSESMGTPSI